VLGCLAEIGINLQDIIERWLVAEGDQIERLHEGYRTIGIRPIGTANPYLDERVVRP
jgi:hypothetical protein